VFLAFTSTSRTWSCQGDVQKERSQTLFCRIFDLQTRHTVDPVPLSLVLLKPRSQDFNTVPRTITVPCFK